MLTSARDHYARQQRITATAVSTARRTRQQGGGRLAAAVALFQGLAARDAIDAVPDMLTEQGISPSSVARVLWESFVGIASDGRPLDSLLEQAYTPEQLDMLVQTQVQDTARAASGVSIAVRPQVTGYVRMLNPPSCSRCAVLAGAFYKWNKGFERHPRCDCRHVPATENTAGDLTTNPDDYFRSLTPEQQDKIFTKAGAQAIRDGADAGQVVNARRGMNAAGTATTSGAKRNRTRPMPEAIYASVGDNRDEVLRLLRLHGYII